MTPLRTSFWLVLLCSAVSAENTNPNLHPKVILGEIGRPVSSSVNATSELIVEYVVPNQGVPEGGALRAQSKSDDARPDEPLLVVVRQKKAVLSWQIPWQQEPPNGPMYSSVTRTICHTPDRSGIDGTQEEESLLVSVSTSSKTSVNFTVNLYVQTVFDLNLGEKYEASLSPSAPIFFRFKGNLLEDGDYDKDAFSDTTALLKMTSNDDLCMVVSVQDLSCPVYDLDKPAAIFQGGLYQTADTVAGITFTRSQFPHGAFLVLVVKSDDEVCRTKAVADDFLLQSLYRQKNVTFSIERKISEQEYLAATAGILFIFGTVYLLVLAVSCTLCCKCNRNSNVSHASERSPLVAEEAPVMNYGSSSIEVTQEEGEQSVEDGADVIQQAPLERLRAHMLHGVVEDERSEDSSLDEIDVDLLLDAETDKDVFRTKATLFVCDLARKSPEVLDKKYNLYKWNLLTVAVFYGLPVVQLVLTYQDVTSATGDLDRCYYNFLCANPLGVFMDFNHVFSNVGYILLGLLFVFLVWRRDVLHRREVREVEGIGRRQQRYFGLPQHFGMYYAMGLALVMEGVMSACYHVCPSHINFQFDTAFMYTISILILLKIYQARHADINANAYTAFGVLAFVIFIASIGVLHGNVYFWAFFSIVHVSSCLILSAQIYYVGRFRLNAGLSRRAWLILVNDVRALISRQWIALKPLYPDRFVLLLLLNAVNWGWIAYGLSSLATERADFASFLLAIFISNVMLYTLFYVVMKLLHGERVGWQPAVYIAAATVTWFGAMYFFVHKSTTWVLPPAQSRHFNQECKLFHFYDNHDIWHLLSAISLFLSFMILLTLDDDLCKIPRDKIFVF